MCRRVTCSICSKPTWSGCGAHVEDVLGDVPVADRCPGHHPDESAGGERRSLLDRLRGSRTGA